MIVFIFFPIRCSPNVYNSVREFDDDCVISEMSLMFLTADSNKINELQERSDADNLRSEKGLKI